MAVALKIPQAWKKFLKPEKKFIEFGKIPRIRKKNFEALKKNFCSSEKKLDNLMSFRYFNSMQQCDIK